MVVGEGMELRSRDDLSFMPSSVLNSIMVRQILAVRLGIHVALAAGRCLRWVSLLRSSCVHTPPQPSAFVAAIAMFYSGYRAFTTTADTPCIGVPSQKPVPRTEVGIKE